MPENENQKGFALAWRGDPRGGEVAGRGGRGGVSSPANVLCVGDRGRRFHRLFSWLFVAYPWLYRRVSDKSVPSTSRLGD